MLPWMTSEEVIVIISMLMTSEYTNEVMDSTCLMAARVQYAINQKSKGLAKIFMTILVVIVHRMF